MATKVSKTSIRRERGWLYYLDKQGDVSRARMARGGGKPAKGKPEKVAKAGVKREEGFLYFIDKQGDVSRTKMARSGGRRVEQLSVRMREDGPGRSTAAASNCDPWLLWMVSTYAVDCTQPPRGALDHLSAALERGSDTLGFALHHHAAVAVVEP